MVIPRCMAADLMLIRTQQAAIVVTTVRAYPNGLNSPSACTRAIRRSSRPTIRMTRPRPADDRADAAAGRHVRRRPLHHDNSRASLPSDDLVGRLTLTPGGGGGRLAQLAHQLLGLPAAPEDPVTLVVSRRYPCPRAAAAIAAPITGASSIRRSSSRAGSSRCVTRHTVHLDRSGRTSLPSRPGPNTVRFRA